jgi:hypothetical protein
MSRNGLSKTHRVLGDFSTWIGASRLKQFENQEQRFAHMPRQFYDRYPKPFCGEILEFKPVSTHDSTSVSLLC